MMDVDQARRGANFNKPHKPAEGESTTRQRWIEMLKKLPQNAGITPDDYKDIIPDTYTQAGNKIGDIEKGMIGAVASLKTDPPRFALMPSGTMRIAGDGTNNFMKEVSAPDKKTAIFDTVLPETSRSTDILRTNIAKALNLKPVQVTYTHLKNLLVS